MMPNRDFLKYKAEVNFLFIENALGDVVSLPMYSLLLTEDLLKAIKTMEHRYGEELKLETHHDKRHFRVWYFMDTDVSRVRIEEFMDGEWEIQHTYRCS